MSENEMARARWMRQKFSSITLAQRMVRKKGEEGLYLYLKRQSEGTWMNSKCHIPSKRVNLYEGGALPRVLDMDR
jgi:hypothetical protein